MATPEDVAEILKRGIAAARAGRKQEAREALLHVVQCDERNEQAWLWLSGVVDRPDDRRVCLENVLAIRPDHPGALAGLRYLDQIAEPGRDQRGVEPAAEEAAQSAPVADVAVGYERCPHCGAPLPPSGITCPTCGGAILVACPACGDYAPVEQASCAHCGYSLGDYRQGPHYYLALAQAAFDRGRRDAAGQLAGYAALSVRKNAQVLEQIAALYEKLGALDLAADVAERAVRADPKNGAAYVRLSSIYRQQGRSAEAQAAVKEAAGLPGDPAVQLELARQYLAIDKTAGEAVALVERALKAQPTNAEAHLLLGDARLKQGRREQAQRHYRDAARLVPIDSSLGMEVHSRLASLQPAAALDSLSEAVGSGQRHVRRRGGRPGCVTLYAILFFLSALGALLGALASGLLGVRSGELLAADIVSAGQFGSFAFIAAAVILAFAALYFAMGVGLWRMKNWARLVVIVLQALGILGVVAQAAAVVLFPEMVPSAAAARVGSGGDLIATAISLAISGYIIFWFSANRELFS